MLSFPVRDVPAVRISDMAEENLSNIDFTALLMLHAIAGPTGNHRTDQKSNHQYESEQLHDSAHTVTALSCTSANPDVIYTLYSTPSDS